VIAIGSRSRTNPGDYSSFVVAVNLVRTDERLVGVVGEQRVELLLEIPNSRAGVRGESLGAQVGGYWRIESNFNNLDPVGLFLGRRSPPRLCRGGVVPPVGVHTRSPGSPEAPGPG